jgi:hypothetical protein
MIKLGPNTLVYFAPLRRDATGFPIRVPEATPITLKEAAERLQSNPYAWVTPVEGSSDILTPQAIEEVFASSSRQPGGE